MSNTFICAFRLKTAYTTNSIIYSLTSLPLSEKLLPSSLYASRGLKAFANVLAILIEIGKVFVGKFLYLFLLVFMGAFAMKSPRGDSFLHIFFFLTLVGSLINTKMFDPAKDKYYAIFLMRMDARKYVLSDYLYFLLKIVIGFFPLSLVFGLLSGVNVFLCLLMPTLVVAVKLIAAACILRKYIRTGVVRNENIPTPIIILEVALLLAAAYIPPLFGYALNGVLFGFLSGTALLLGVFALLFLWHFTEYRKIYQQILSPESLLATPNTEGASLQKNYLKKLDAAENATSDKTGYAYFNDLFLKRHRRILTKSAKTIALIAAGLLIISISAALIFPSLKTQINGMLLTYLPYFLFVMYFLNRGKIVTQAMFMNCDHSMLTYRFYRQPKVILSLFAARLKSVIWIDFLPSSVIAFGLALLLFVTGGTDNFLHYPILVVSILTMSAFFSVHNMVLYYLLQPYNVNIEMKSFTFTVINYVTYFACYFIMRLSIPTMIFGTLLIVFCGVYIGIALLLAYKLAPKTFKLRQ